MAYVYRHIRLDKNEPFYIGIGSDSAFKRAKEIAKRNKFWHNIVNKTPYEVEILFDDISWGEACKKEIEFIKLYGRKNLGEGTLCNLTNGGEGAKGKIVSESTKLKLSIANTGKKQSEETLKKLSIIRTGKKGRFFTDEQKKETSERKKGNTYWLGKKHSEKSKEKMSLLRKGKMSEYNKLLITERNKGNIYALGRSRTSQEKLAISLKNSKPIVCINTNKTYNSLTIAALELNLKVSDICAVLKRKQKTTKGMTFKYII